MKTIRIFNHLGDGFKNVDRAGTNVITETLHNRNNNAFAVMNKNSVSGLGRAEVSGYPEEPNKRNVDGALYAQFCAEAAVVRKNLGLAEFSALDARLNDAYW